MLSQLWDLNRFRYVTRFAIVVVLFLSLAYPLSLNILLINDSRYHAEDWIADNIARESTLLAVGPLQYLPRFELAHENIKWLRNDLSSFSKFQATKDYDFLLSELSFSEFEKHQFNYLIISSLSKKTMQSFSL